MLCQFGCGQDGKFQFKNGKWCCNKSQNSCPVIKEKTKAPIRGRTKENNKSRKTQAEKLSGRKLSEERKEKQRHPQKSHKSPGPLSNITKIKIQEKLKGRIFTEEWKRKLRKPKPEGFGEKIRNLWKDPKYQQKLYESQNKKPNNCEIIILKLLDKLYPNEWKYTGDYSFWINGKNPDFTCTNGKKLLIEHFGTWWHKEDDPEERKKIFKKFGYETLVIWEKELKDIKLRAIDEAKHIVSKANTIIEQSVREIKESSAGRQVIKKAKEEINQVSREFEQMLEEIQPAPVINEFQIGDNVRFRQSNTTGEIALKIDENYSIVIIGDVRMKVHRRDLELVEQKKTYATKSVDMPYPLTIEIKKEIDLRGMYGDEAIAEVDKFIDQAIISGLHRIDIIHGKGTGALRKKITEYLKNNSSIKSFRLGEWNEGGTGVTVVELV